MFKKLFLSTAAVACLASSIFSEDSKITFEEFYNKTNEIVESPSEGLSMKIVNKPGPVTGKKSKSIDIKKDVSMKIVNKPVPVSEIPKTKKSIFSDEEMAELEGRVDSSEYVPAPIEEEYVDFDMTLPDSQVSETYVDTVVKKDTVYVDSSITKPVEKTEKVVKKSIDDKILPTDFKLPSETDNYKGALNNGSYERLAAEIISQSVKKGEWTPIGEFDFYVDVSEMMADKYLKSTDKGFMLTESALKKIAKKYKN